LFHALIVSGALATVIVAWTRTGQPGTYGLDVIASYATLKLALAVAVAAERALATSAVQGAWIEY
jgi:hypothetical protein